MEIYASKSDQPIVDWQWHEPSLRNITSLVLRFAPRVRGQALDVGCGTGRVSFALAERGYTVRGIDSEARVIDLARRIAAGRACGGKGQGRVEFAVGDFRSAAVVQPNAYDLVVCSEVLEHIEDYHPVIEHMHAALKPGGRLIITVPCDPQKWSVLDQYGGHVRRFTAAQMRADLRQFSNIRTMVTGFPFYRLLVRSYLVKTRLLGQQHSNELLWEKPTTRLIAAAAYPFMRLDNLFAFTHLGDALIAVADKPSGAETAAVAAA